MTSTRIAGSSSGTSGDSGDGGAATSATLNSPVGVALDAAGDLYIADQANNRVQEVAAGTGTQWGQSMTADDIYTVAGSSSGTSGYSGDGGAATSATLSGPHGVAIDSVRGTSTSATPANNRVQEVAHPTHSQWGQSMTAERHLHRGRELDGVLGALRRRRGRHLGHLDRPVRGGLRRLPATSTSPTTTTTASKK